MCVCVWVCGYDKTKSPDQNDLRLGKIVVFDTVSKPTDFGSKGQGSEAQGLLACVFSDRRRFQTHGEESFIPVLMFIYADDIVSK